MTFYALRPLSTTLIAVTFRLTYALYVATTLAGHPKKNRYKDVQLSTNILLIQERVLNNKHKSQVATKHARTITLQSTQALTNSDKSPKRAPDENM